MTRYGSPTSVHLIPVNNGDPGWTCVLGALDDFPVDDDNGNIDGSSSPFPRLKIQGPPVAWPCQTETCTTQTNNKIADA